MKQLFSLISLLLLTTVGMAQNPIADNQGTFNIFRDGKMPTSSGEVFEAWNINDSLLHIPSYDTY
ncbi:MAG TPA: hypothetical protein VJ949_04505, partial [Cryomorphaceae bacterium]|nr:hypothetical protein [Cryomorphaceae bacterium]